MCLGILQFIVRSVLFLKLRFIDLHQGLTTRVMFTCDCLYMLRIFEYMLTVR